MPAKSVAQQMMMGAELQRKRVGAPTKTNMSEKQLSDFASTPQKGLPKKVAAKKKGSPKKGKDFSFTK